MDNAEDTPILCRDDKDNDGDGRVDCDDQDCQPLYTCTVDDDTETDSSSASDEDIWVKIYSSTFQMGSDDDDPSEAPMHPVYILSFEIMRTEVTVAMYQACMSDGACEEPASFADCISSEYSALMEAAPEQYPMACVNWYQAAAFCEWFDARLPSEAEWEKMASSGQLEKTYPWGDSNASCGLAVIDYESDGPGCGLGHPWPVCSKPSGNTGNEICDAIGNVREWLEDDIHPNYEGAPTNGDPWIDDPRGEGRIVRGSAFDDGWEITASTRRWCDPEEGCDISDEMNGYGFRCAR